MRGNSLFPINFCVDLETCHQSESGYNKANNIVRVVHPKPMCFVITLRG